MPVDLLLPLLASYPPTVLARALSQQPPYARAVLAVEQGLTDTAEVRALLQTVQDVPVLPLSPDPPVLSAAGRAMWVRLLAGCLIIGQDLAPGGGLTRLEGGATLEARLYEAQVWAAMQHKPLVYAVRDWSVIEEAHQAQGTEVVTLEEAVLTLAGRSRTQLDRLARWAQGVVVLDDLHTFDPRGLIALEELLGAAVEQGLHVAVTGRFPHPLHEQLHSETDHGLFRFHPEHHEITDVLALVEQEGSTLILVPSRRAALELQQQLPGARLTTRTKTVQHLVEEAATATQVQIATWGSVSLRPGQYDRIITTRMPWPILAEAALSTTRLDVVPVTAWRVPAPLVTAQSVTDELLQSGVHPLDPASHQRYWQLLGPFVQDSLGLAASTIQLNFRELHFKFRQLFQSGVTVLVQQPGSIPDVARARRTGRIPISLYTAVISQSSFRRAQERGWLEEVGQAVIWIGPYTQEHGLGLG